MNEAESNELLEEWMDELYECAHAYLKRGWSIIPISLETKKPIISWKRFSEKPPTKELVEEWFTEGVETASGFRVKEFNLGLVTGAVSGVIVADADNQTAINAATKYGLATPYMVSTKRGKHFYWKHPGKGLRFKNRAGANPGTGWPSVDGLDLRGDGGYVVLPPSLRFDKDGNFTHKYEWQLPAIHEDEIMDLLPVWKGEPDDTPRVETGEAGGFRFDELSLELVRVAGESSEMSVWQQCQQAMDERGRKLMEGCGEATDAWMIRYIGEQVSNGLGKDECITQGVAFAEHFFDSGADEWWVRRKVDSAVEMDKRNHPDHYDDQGNRIKQEEKPEEGPVQLRPIMFADLDDIEANLKQQEYLIDPVLAPGNIIQIVGYNGHGKSLFMQGLLHCLAAGHGMGPYDIAEPKRVLYLDFENPAGTIVDRMRMYNEVFGSTGNRFGMWTPTLIPPEKGGEMNLKTDAGTRLLASWITSWHPDILGIDTIRTAFPGLEERSAEEWANLNSLVKQIRDAGICVVLNHHRNKPGADGLGREAGSTAQLTLLDVQLVVTQIYENGADAERFAGLLDEKLSVYDAANREWTPFTYLKDRAGPDYRLVTVQEISYGKIRQRTDNHDTQYIGWAEPMHGSGKRRLVATASPKQKAVLLANSGVSIPDIAQQLMIPSRTLRDWTGR